MEGKVIGKVTEEELDQLKDFLNRDIAIYKMIEKLVAQQKQLEVDQEQWFNAIRKQYGIKKDIKITVLHKTGNIIEEPVVSE